MTLSASHAQDCVALAEIELCGELMIAASAALEDRLSHDRIDEVLNVRQDADAVIGVGQDPDAVIDVTRGAASVIDLGQGADAVLDEPAPRVPRQSHSVRRG
ncbi:hypothetical protein AB0G71_04135 [Streptomyces sp. NPDC020403]|uniref:hypothetical protein n=1 Tax=unclassified Streptomyces TaxID=2593676 RepID=UPI0033C7B607